MYLLLPRACYVTPIMTHRLTSEAKPMPLPADADGDQPGPCGQRGELGAVGAVVGGLGGGEVGDLGAPAAEVLEVGAFQAEFGGDQCRRIVVLGAVAAWRVPGLEGYAGAYGLGVAQGHVRSLRCDRGRRRRHVR